MIPWGLLETNPLLVVLVPFGWLLWQLYIPTIIDTLVGYDTEDTDRPQHLYETRLTQALHNVFSQFDRVDNRIDSIGSDVEQIAETQEDLVNITLAQSHQMNGHDGDIDVDSVEETLLDDEKEGPRRFLKDTAPSPPDAEDDGEE